MLTEVVLLREPVRDTEALPDGVAVCVTDLDPAGLLVAVAAPELLFDTEVDAV
jgi:hypothetical protein